VNRELLRSPDRARLRPYAFVVDTFVRPDPPSARQAVRPGRRLGWLPGSARPRPIRWSGDVLVVGEASGASELDFVERLVRGLAAAGRSVLYLATGPAEAARLRGLPRVTVHEVTPGSPRVSGEDWEALAPVLRCAGASLGRDAERVMGEVAAAREVWRSLSSSLDARTLIARSNYRPLSAVALAEAACPTVCFQHSVVTAPASFVPIPSRRFVTFGETSRALLERLDREMAASVGAPRICQDLVASGSLTDPVLSSAGSPSGPVLIIDSGEGFAPRFLGVAEAYASLEATARRLAAAGVPVMVRAHPRGGARRWKGLPVSTGRALADDLRGASAVIGLFSTVLPVAAASGLPTLFLWKPGWFATPDLAPFAPHRVAPEDVVERLRERRPARAVASAYVAGLRRCEFTPEDLEVLLTAT